MSRRSPRTPRRTAVTGALAAVFIASAAASNWTIQHVGQNNGPYAPHTIPIGWGLHAASGVLLVGAMITLRDALHEQIGIKGTVLVIAIASLISGLLAPPPVAIASSVTMLAAETADALVYQRLRLRGYLIAGAASNLVSSLIDSALFLFIAYGVTAMRHGTYPLTIGKIEASLVTLAVLAIAARTFRPRRTPIRGTSPSTRYHSTGLAMAPEPSAADQIVPSVPERQQAPGASKVPPLESDCRTGRLSRPSRAASLKDTNQVFSPHPSAQ